MLKNYFKIALRNIVRRKGYAAINITGLATGIAACMLIYMFVNHELSFDRFHADSRNIYRLVFDYKFPDKLDHLAVAAPVAGITLRRDYPEVMNYTTITPYSGNKLLVKYGTTKFYEENIYIADSTFFTVFDYQWLKGNKKTALDAPNTVVIDESMAKKYFGKEDPIGKTLEYDNNDGTFASYKITGVFKDVPSNSHLVFNSLVSYKTLQVLYGAQGLNSWHNAGSFVFLQMREGTNIPAFGKKIAHLYDKYADQYKNVRASISMQLEPLTGIHLYSDKLFDSAVKGNVAYVYIFAVVAVFLLVIAGINYINLATAQGKVRMKEIGVRKVIGAGRKKLIGQFIFESALVVFFSVLVSQVIMLICLPVFNYLTDLHISFFGIYTFKNILLLALLSLFVILLAGIYPAFYLTSYAPAFALKGNSTGEKGITLRKVLVIAQFTISIVLITSTLIVRNQVNYMLDHDPGFNKDGIMAIRFQDTLTVSNYKAIKQDLLQLKGVSKVTQSSTLPGDPPDRKITRVEGKNPGTINEIPLEPIWVDPDYFELMQVHLKEGRLFDRSRTLDLRESFVVNESAAKKFGWDKTLDKKVIWGFGRSQREGKVIGVVRDIHTTSLKKETEPILFVCDENPGKAYTQGYLLVRLDNGNKERIIKDVCNTWAKYDKVHPPDYKFLDENMTGLYTTEQKTNSLFRYLSLLTIIIACLGLFGLVSFSVSQRIKEIGVRKVLGASVADVAALLSRDFLNLVFVAFIIAVPVSWYTMHKWLEDFAFRISIPWWTFLVSGTIAFAIALLTVSFQAIRAAVANPVKSLRTE